MFAAERQSFGEPPRTTGTMAQAPRDDLQLPDPAEFSRNLLKVAQQSQQLVTEFLRRRVERQGDQPLDPLNIGSAFLEMTARLLADPKRLAEAHLDLWQDHVRLWHHAAMRMLGRESAPVIEPARDDRRFRDSAWQESQVFDFIKQSYLLTARWLQRSAQQVEGLDDKVAKKVDFYTRQFVDAMAPSNFVLTNPEVLRTTFAQNGENLVRGLDNMLADLERGAGRLDIRMTDHDAFEVGGNVAVTPGKVVWRNDLMELIQYAPTTERVCKRPLVIVPPWINKFYILDLKPANSFVKFAVDRGLTVFMVSWVNPDARLAEKSFEDYMREGVLEALDAMREATGEADANIVGYCLGGTLTAATIAYLAATKDARVASATFLASLTDFEEAGELCIFIDEEQLDYLERRMREHGGVLDGAAMAATFNMLRANDLIWSFVINNYLLGKEPFPFDLLYWNSDSTRMPAEMHSFYLRNMYQRNLLTEPGGIELCGVPIDLREVRIPVYMLSTREDHIAPWKATYVATQLFQGPTRFTLAGSGHIAGVVNPPATAKYGYWTNSDLPPDPDDWLAGAASQAGSWWPDWADWIRRQSGAEVAARKPGGGKARPLCDAPGEYVKVRADE
jgi:polyhydroxyalkanoate synthase